MTAKQEISFVSIDSASYDVALHADTAMSCSCSTQGAWYLWFNVELCLGLPLGLEAPVMAPNSVTFLFSSSLALYSLLTLHCFPTAGNSIDNADLNYQI